VSRVTSEDVGLFYHHYPRLAAIVTAHSEEKDNAMTVDWHTPLSLNPPLYGILVAPGRFTYRLIIASREFGINFMPFEAVELVHSVGSSPGQQMDKFQEFNIARDRPLKTRVPVLKDAYAAYECELVDDREYGDHRLLVGKIVAVHLSTESFTPEGTLALDKVSPVLYLGHEFYVDLSKGT
jgi:flavin reductase (DIM6/NTAB) family NADH-FMN oxidoreductase RutF